MYAMKSCNVSIAFADDSIVTATEKRTRSVSWKTKNGTMRVNLLETFIAFDMATSFLSVPALVKRNNCVTFLWRKPLLVDLDNKLPVIAYLRRGGSELFYTSNNQESVPAQELKFAGKNCNAVMAILRDHYTLPAMLETDREIKELTQQWNIVEDWNRMGGRPKMLYEQSYVRFKWWKIV